MASLGRSTWSNGLGETDGLDTEKTLLQRTPIGNENDADGMSRLQRSSSYGSLPVLKSTKLYRYRRPGPGMQLPSFEELGISSLGTKLFERHNADHQGHQKALAPRTHVHRSSHRSDPPALQSPVPFLGSTPLLTPPDDIDSIRWNMACTNASTSVGPFRKVSPQTATSGFIEASTNGQDDTGDGGQSSQDAQQTEHTAGHSHLELGGLSTDQAATFLDLGIGANITSITTPDAQLNGITVISQTLPHPLQDTTNPHSAFTSTIQAIQSKFEGRRCPYIKITHAVPPQFTLRNLPSSPPSTPNHQGGEDYFSLSVFANAAPVPTYHHYDGSIDKSAPSSPAPIVPPATVQVALVERYIPPSTAQEHMAFFSANGPSVLIDRLVELTPNGGSLMLIYPTKKGAHSFRSNHVGPLLDSLLRTMVVVHDMSSDLASSLGRMPAVNEMLSFEEMKAKVNALCHHLSRQTSSPSRRGEYSMVYANAGEAPLDRRAWSEWFLQQETPRMRAILKSYWQRGKKLPSASESVIPATLMRDVKICIEEGKYEDDVPQSGIEVGVFVIRRSK